MIRLHVKLGILGSGPVRSAEVEWRAQTPAALASAVAEQLPDGSDVIVAVNGQVVPAERMHEPLDDGSDVVVTTQPHAFAVFGIFILDLLFNIAVIAAISYASQLLIGRPKAPGVEQKRGDSESAVGDWSGITTSHGQGLIVPFGYGYHAIGGQVIGSQIEQGQTSRDPEILRLLIALGEGRVEDVGGVVGGAFGEQNAMVPNGSGPWPDGLILNGNRVANNGSYQVARAWMRAGEIGQTPLPPPWVGATTTFAVNLDLGSAAGNSGPDPVFTYEGEDEVQTVRFLISFPGGLYEVGNNGTNQSVTLTFGLFWGRPGQARSLFFDPVTGQQSFRTITRTTVGPFTLVFEGRTVMSGPLPRGPLEFQVQQFNQGTPTQQTVAFSTWRQVSVSLPGTFAYPRVALLGLEIPATDQVSGSQLAVQVPVRWTRLRVWDATLGWSPRTWHRPAAPFNWMTYPPGQNPAWVAVDFLLAPWGGGKWIREANIDLPAFRRWSIWCDTNPGPIGDKWDEARYRYDRVSDTTRPIWERLLEICQAGGAVPYRKGNIISVYYQFRDAHSDALVSVPDKSPVQLFTSQNVEALSVQWLDRSLRPTVVNYQFQNESKLWAQDVFPFEDPESAQDPTQVIVDQYRQETIQAFGITRESQLVRDGFLFHRMNRLVGFRVEFTAGVHALACEIGDLIQVEHDVVRPFGGDVSSAATVRVGGTAVTTIVLARVVTGTGLAVAVRDPDGKAIVATVSSLTPVTGGTQLTLGSAVTCAEGASAVIGLADKLTLTYQVVSITLEQRLRRRVTAVEWVPEVFDEIPASDWAEEESGVDQVNEPESIAAPPLAVTMRPDGRGGQVVYWDPPEGTGTQTSRVYGRPSSDLPWALLGETVEGRLAVDGLAPWSTWQLSVVHRTSAGVFPPADEGLLATVEVQEFPWRHPPDITRAAVAVLSRGLLLSWAPLDVVDLAEYEVRVGTWWSDQVVYRGRLPQVLLEDPAVGPGVPLQIAARSTGGVYSAQPLEVIVAAWEPPGTVVEATADEVAGSPPGTLTDLVVDTSGDFVPSPALVIDDGQFEGTYVSAELDAGADDEFYWQVLVDAVEIDVGTTVDDCTWELDSGEARWTRVEGRPASVGRPGIEWDLQVDDLTMTIDDMPTELQCHGYRGTAGTHTRCLVESRYQLGGVWSDWEPHHNDTRTARRLQVRVTLSRESEQWQRFLRTLTLTAYA